MRKSVIITASIIALASSNAFAAAKINFDGQEITKQKRCGMEWKSTKADHKDLTWPKYWHFCSVAAKSNDKVLAEPIGKMKFDTK